MSNTLSLTHSYGSFFWGCTKVAISPYTATFNAIANSSKENNDIETAVAATAVCGILTFVVPVLPMLTSITGTFAAIAALLAIYSMFLTYPVAITLDACTPDGDNEFSLSVRT
jgi:hypothetical protein